MSRNAQMRPVQDPPSPDKPKQPDPSPTPPTPAPAAPAPTIGRMLHFYPARVVNKYPAPPQLTNEWDDAKKQPYSATVTHVQADGTVNLAIAQDGEFPLKDLYPTRVAQRKSPTSAGWDWPKRS